MAPGSPAPDATVSLTRDVRAREYEDLRLFIEGSRGEYRASVIESPAGETSAPETIRWSSHPQRLEKEGEVQRAGAALFDAFLAGQIRELYRASIASTSARHKGLRLKLLIDPPELCGAPWELLYDRNNRRYIGLSTKTAIVRHPKIPQAVEPLTVQPPLRVLGVVANPLDPDLPPLDVEKERMLIEKALTDVRQARLVELKWLPNATWQDLQQAMWQGWHVFHFCGHGDYDEQAGEGYLVFEDPGGKPHRLAATQLGLLLREQGDMRVAILNSCKGAVGDSSASSSSVAGALVRSGLGGVVSMQNPITDRAALTFARVTYLGIAAGLPLEAALGSARVAMALEHATPIEWWTPVLHMRSRDGALFSIPGSVAESHPKVRGIEYLDPELDSRLERELARRRRWKRAFFSLLLAPIPVLGFLTATPVTSSTIRAEIESSGVTLGLTSGHELFGELARLQQFTASGFSQLLPPGSAFPQKPGPGQEAVLTAEAADTGSWISLQPWALPAGSVVTWDHPRGARSGEYLLKLTTGADRRFHADLVHRIKLSRFGSAAELRDYTDNSSLQIVTSSAPLELTLRFLQPNRITGPRLNVDSLQMRRQGFDDDGPVAESTVLTANVHVDGRDTVLEATHLTLSGLHNAAVDQLRLVDSGVAFSLSGSVQQVIIGARAIEFSSKLQWVIRERPLLLVVGTIAYALILLIALLSWRTIL